MAVAITTERAALVAAHPLPVLERQPTGEPVPLLPLVGCMTGASNEVSEQLARIDLPPKVTRFLRCLERATFGWAGVHRAQGHAQPGAWCWFALTEWVERTTMSRSQILHIRQRLVDDGLIWYEPDETTRGRGRIGWNLDFASWKPLKTEYKHWGGVRPGAGRPRKVMAERVVILKNENEGITHDDLPARSTPEKNSSLQLLEEQGIVILKTASEEVASSDESYHTTPGENSRLQLAERTRLSSLQQPGLSSLQLEAGSQEFKMTTPVLVQSAQGAPSDQSLRRRLRKKNTETPDRVSEGASPSPTALPDAGEQDGSAAGAPSSSELTMSAHTPDEHTPIEAASVPQVSKQEAYWPPRLEWERTDLDYYQRVLREREKERVALLTRLAHERIGVPLESASYARIGALAKQAGAALLVKHILLAAANHIDGDPLDYLTRLARGQQKKEAAHATRPAAPTSGYQPYSAEEASQLVWNSL